MVLDNFRTIELIWDKANKSIIKTIKTASSDTTGRYLSVKILDGGQEVTLNNAKLQLYWEHPNFNTSGTDDFNTVNNGGLFKMTFSDEMLTNIGELNAHLVLTLSDGTITSGGFPIEVFKGADSGVVVPVNGNGLVKQVANKIDKGNVTLNDLTQEVKLAMTGGSLPIVGENAVDTENIKDNSVTHQKTTFINQSENLFNKNDSEIITGRMIQYNGNVIDFARGAISHKIKVKPNDVLTGDFAINLFGGSGKGYFYNEDGTYISAVTPTLTGNIGTLTVPDNTEISYMLFNLNTDPETNPIETTMLVFGTTYPQSYIPFSFILTNDFSLNETQKSEVDYQIANLGNKLNNKVIVFDGDSIANAINDPQDGWAGRIATNNKMAYTNYAVDGGTITAGLMAGTNPRHWVSRSVANYRADADYIILEGGTNDADLIGVANMGEISHGFNAVLDDTTFTGAVESTIKQTILKYPDKKIGFIIAHRMGSVEQQEIRRAFFDRIIEVCEKWGIPYLDVWKNSYLNPVLPELKSVYFSDSQHLTTAGYDHITPMIEEWIKTL